MLKLCPEKNIEMPSNTKVVSFCTWMYFSFIYLFLAKDWLLFHLIVSFQVKPL